MSEQDAWNEGYTTGFADSAVPLDKTEMPVSDELKSWARVTLGQHEAVAALHVVEIRWMLPGAAEHSFDSEEEALAAGDATDPADLQTFPICAECGRQERESLMAHEVDTWTYLSSLWPCRTARALGAPD